MIYYVLTGLVNAIASTVLGFFVYSINKISPLNRSFARFCIAVAVWSWAYCFWPLAVGREDTLFWFRVLHIGAIIIPPTYLHFVLTFLDFDKKKRSLIISSYLLSAIFLAADFSTLFIADMVPNNILPYWAVPGPLYHLFLLSFFGSTIYCWYYLFKASRESDPTKRIQARYILAGTLIGFLGGSTNYLLWYGIPVPPLGNGLVVLYIILTALAVVRYHLFEIKLILTELMVGTMSIILLVNPFLMPTTALKFLTGIIFILFCIFGYYLIRETQEESKRREEAEMVAVRERELRKEAEALAANLKHLNQAKNQFLLSTQHHLRSPLSVVQGYLSMIAEGNYGKISVKVKKKIDASLEATRKLVQIVDELLDVAHFQMNKGLVEKQPTNIVALAAEIVADLDQSAASKKICLRFEGPPSPLPLIDIDPKGIREAVYNVIDNAIKYTNEGRVTVSLAVAGGNLVITIADTGIGMDEGDRLNLFNRTFERGKEAKEVNANGKGIGLYLAARMIVGNGGKIRAESEGRGKGSKFIIELPMKVNPTPTGAESLVPVE